MRLSPLVMAVVMTGGCGAQLSNGDPSLGSINSLPDGGAGGTTCTSRSVYLNFDGGILTRGVNGASDATKNQAGWMQIPIGAVPPYQAGNAGRSAAIQTIVAGVTTQLAQFPITVTTQRPAAGNYTMIVFGGDRALVGSNFGAAVNQLDCGDVYPNDVAWISDSVSPPQRVINSVIGAIGFGLGLTATSDPKDCMCSWDNDCKSDNSAACTLGAPIARDPAANQLCPGLSSQDEVAAIRAAFCH